MFVSRILSATALVLLWTRSAHAGGFQVPEPASIILISLGVAGAAWWGRRRR
jgi:hypothetical protein